MKQKKRTLRNSFADAGRGLLFAIKTERNMRIHVTVAVYVLFFAPFLQVTRGEYAALLLAVSVVMTAEGFNTAIEMLCDFTQKSYNRFIGKTKDIAAGAVLVSAIFAACVGAVILWRPKALWLLLCAIGASPLYITLFILSGILATAFVFIGPMGIGNFLEKRKKG